MLQERATIVVHDRPGAPGGLPPAGWAYEKVDLPQFEVSSTDIRARVRDGRPIDGLVVPAVVRHIRARGLYTGTGPAAANRASAPAVSG